MHNIYLVRHAQSHSNMEPSILQKICNPSIELTDTGVKQALETALFFKQLELSKVHIWNSPYFRTRKTSKIIYDELISSNTKTSILENIHIVERQFGIVDDVVDYGTKYPDFMNHYALHNQHQASFFARPPMGESPFDVSLRVDFFIHNYLIPYFKKESHQIVVSHGAAIRCILMMMLGWEHEEVFRVPNPHNASVRHLTYDDQTLLFKDHGYIFSPSIESK